jgi:hypothetical protein
VLSCLVNITASHLLYAGSLLLLFFDPEDTGAMLLRNFGWLSTGFQVVVHQMTEIFIQIMFKNTVSTSNKPLYLHYKHQPAIAVSLFPVAPTLEHRASVKGLASLQFLNPKTVGRTAWTEGISPSQGRCLHRTTQTQNKRTQIFVPWVGFEPTIPAIERAKTVRALEHAATVTGCCCIGKEVIVVYCENHRKDTNTACRISDC